MSENIIKELQRRHDAGKAKGDDRLHLDAIELIATLTQELADAEQKILDLNIDWAVQVKKACDEIQSFGNVLAVIHKDGGHYITEHGHEKASRDAIEIVTAQSKEIEGLRGVLEKIQYMDGDEFNDNSPLNAPKLAEQTLNPKGKCKTCNGSGYKPRVKHCSIGRCVKSHERITCSPNGIQCEHYIEQEKCPDCKDTK